MRVFYPAPLLFTLAFLLSACNSPSHVDSAITTCCAGSGYETFSTQAENIPAFLGPLMVSNFTVAFTNTGMQPVETDPDLRVVLRYEQTNLSHPEPRDDFEERLSTGETMRFIARIVVEMRDAKSQKIVWAGQIQRLHDVSPGDYMHTGIASISIYEAFTILLRKYK